VDPSPLGIPTWLYLHFVVGDEEVYTVYCEMPDDGSFQVPAALLVEPAVPRVATVLLRRSDVRLLPIDDERTIRVSADSTLAGLVSVL
jgi:hypothetical protein